MPYVLGKVKRTVDGQPIGDIEDLDGANITGFVKNDDGTFTITGKNSSDEDISVTLDLREVRPSDELTASGLADADRHFVLDVSTDPISLKFIQTQNLKTVFGGTAELISAPFDLTALSKVTKTLSEDITNFKNIMIIGGDGTTFGRGLGSTMVPRSEIPTSDGSVDQYLYGISGGSSARLYRINQSNGAIAVDIGSMGSRYGGLAEVNGAVYAYNINSGLYSVDLETGSASRIGGSTYSGDDVVALGSVNDVLYLVHTEESGANNSDLYSLNVATGARTLVRDNFLSSNNKIISLGGLGEVLYGRSDGNRLYSNLQPGGSITNVGGLGVSSMSGMAGVGSTLYGSRIITGGSEIYSIDVSTGVATSLGTNTIGIGSLAGVDAGVAAAARIHVIPSKRVDIWRPDNTTDELGFYSDRPTTILRVLGFR